MKNIAFAIDILLFALVALTVGLIAFKALHLFAPGLFKQDAVGRLGSTKKDLDEAIERLEAGLPLMAVIASTAPFIGLGGTVMHIIEALRALSGSAVDITLISGPIATALNSTLVGLGSAVPAAIAYNLLQRKLQLIYNRRCRELT